MTVTFRNHLLSACTAAGFFLLASASTVNKLHQGSFNRSEMVEDKSETRNFLVMNDGTRIYGNKINWSGGIIVNHVIKIDDQKFKSAEVRGYQYKQAYYGRLGSFYMQRIVHGKINVYIREENSWETTAGAPGGRNVVHTFYYSQQGENGTMNQIANQSDMKKALSDCPLAVSMVDISSSKIRKSLRKNRNYLNEAFEIYNNDCQPLSR